VPIRKGSRRVTVYNEGLLVFLYDEANAASLGAAAEALHDFRCLHNWKDDPSLGALAAKNAIVVYEIDQDRGLDVEVVVGPPLEKAELAGVHWHAPQRARLGLPTGTLCLDSINSFRASVPWIPAEAGHVPERGGTVRIPPGDYDVTVHRLFTDRMRAEGIPTRPHPGEVLVLTPAGTGSHAPQPLFLPLPGARG
jgi:hypothetical protein